MESNKTILESLQKELFAMTVNDRVAKFYQLDKVIQTGLNLLAVLHIREGHRNFYEKSPGKLRPDFIKFYESEGRENLKKQIEICLAELEALSLPFTKTKNEILK